MGFIATSFRAFTLSYINHYMVHRGPDGTSHERHVEPLYTTDFVANRRHSGGVREQQPFRSADNQTWALMDGTLYDGSDGGPNARSDGGRAVLAAYAAHGVHFGAFLDGEFAAVVVDFKLGVAVGATDPFGTKNLWMGVDSGEWGLASCDSPLSKLGIRRKHRELLVADSAVVLNISGRAAVAQRISALRSFAAAAEPIAAAAAADDAATAAQTGAAVAAWRAALDAAVMRRLPAREKRRANIVLPFAALGLRSSSTAPEGDGTLACALAMSDAPHGLLLVERQAASSSSSALAQERAAFAMNNGQLTRARDVREGGNDWSGEHAILFKRTPETLLWGTHEGATVHDVPLLGTAAVEPDAENGGSLDVRMQRESALLSNAYGLARKDRAFVHLSSLGAPGGGDKPLLSSALRGQLMQDDIVAGAHGIEIRYPFLDTAVVQAFMRLPRAVREAAPGTEDSVLRKYMRAQRCPVEPATPSKDEL